MPTEPRLLFLGALSAGLLASGCGLDMASLPLVSQDSGSKPMAAPRTDPGDVRTQTVQSASSGDNGVSAQAGMPCHSTGSSAGMMAGGAQMMDDETMRASMDQMMASMGQMSKGNASNSMMSMMSGGQTADSTTTSAAPTGAVAAPQEATPGGDGHSGHH